MAVTTTTRIPITRWSDSTVDTFSRAQMDASHAAIDTYAARDEQGTLAGRPAAGIRGRWYFTTDTHDLSRDDGAAYWKVTLNDVQANRTAGLSIAVDSVTAGSGSGYAPLVVTRGFSGVAGPMIGLYRDASTNHPAIGLDATSNDQITLGIATSGGAWSTILAKFSLIGNWQAIGDNHYFGAGALGATGTRIHLGSFADAANAYVAADGSPATVGLILRSQGSTSLVTIQPNSATAATFSDPSSLSATQTPLTVQVNLAGTVVGRRLLVDAADTAGAGFRRVMVAN